MNDAQYDIILAERALHHLSVAEGAIGMISTWRGSRWAKRKVEKVRKRVKKAFRF